MVFKSIIGATCACLAVASINADAAILSYTDKGLDFAINDNDHFAPTISFSDKTFLPTLASPLSFSSTIQTGTQFVPQPFPNAPLTTGIFATITITLDSLSSISVGGGN